MTETKEKAAGHDEIVAITGPLENGVVASIIALGANAAEVLEAWTWLEGDEELGPEARHRLSGTVAAVYDLLAADRFADEDDRRA